MFEKQLAALAAQIESARLVCVCDGQLAVGIELVISLQNFVDVFQVVAVIVDCGLRFHGRGVHFHAYYIARVVLGIELAIA
jgi:hypothetical protein